MRKAKLANASLGPWSTKGKPSIVETHPHLVEEFVEVVDQPARTLGTITSGMRLMIRWRCGRGHVYPALVLNRSHGRGCRQCWRETPVPPLPPVFIGKVRLRDVRPDLRDEFVSMCAEPFFPFDEVSASSQKRARWRCRDCSHEWETTVGNRYNHNTLCPKCEAISRVQRPFGESLAALYPDLAAEFVEVPGAPHRTAENLGPTTNADVLWRCSACSFEWKNRVGNRVYLKSGCPRCANAPGRLFPGDSLADRSPELTAELVAVLGFKGDRSPSGLTAFEVRAGSDRYALWRCGMPGCAHEWQTMLGARYRSGSGCPRCVAPLHSSAVEIRLACELASFPSLSFDVDAGEVRLEGVARAQHCDMVAPALRLIVEYDGSRWHADKLERDRVKTELLEAAGWRVLRLREGPLEPVSAWSLPVPKKSTPKALADLVATELTAKGFLPQSELDEYLALSGARAAEHAAEVLKRRRVRRFSSRSAPQPPPAG